MAIRLPPKFRMAVCYWSQTILQKNEIEESAKLVAYFRQLPDPLKPESL